MNMESLEGKDGGGKRSPQAWKLRLPWEQQKQAEIQRSAFLQSQENARASTSSMSTFARAFMISRRRLRLDPDKKLHFLCKPALNLINYLVTSCCPLVTLL